MGNKQATREAYGKVLVELGKENSNLIVMDADLSGSTKTGEFAKVFPERFFNMGSRTYTLQRQELLFRERLYAHRHLRCLRQEEPLRLLEIQSDIHLLMLKFVQAMQG